MNKGDVEVTDIPGLLCVECSDENVEDHKTVRATKIILLHFRAAGMTVQFGEGLNALYCDNCANEMAERLRASLPDDEEE